MSSPAVRVEGLGKSYGDVQAVEDLSMTVERGEIYGLVGPNGAGKSTTLRTLATLLSVEDGTVEVSGHDVATEAATVRQTMRYLPEEAGAYENLTGRQYLQFVADCCDGDDDAIARAARVADLGDRLEDKTSDYSKGMTRKLLLAATLMTEPELAILDEPTSGLDVRNARRVRAVIQAFPDDGRSVVLSSHDMFEVEHVCDRVGLLDDGHIVAEGTPAELKARHDAASLEDVFVAVVEDGDDPAADLPGDAASGAARRPDQPAAGTDEEVSDS